MGTFVAFMNGAGTMQIPNGVFLALLAFLGLLIAAGVGYAFLRGKFPLHKKG